MARISKNKKWTGFFYQTTMRDLIGGSIVSADATAWADKEALALINKIASKTKASMDALGKRAPKKLSGNMVDSALQTIDAPFLKQVSIDQRKGAKLTDARVRRALRKSWGMVSKDAVIKTQLIVVNYIASLGECARAINKEYGLKKVTVKALALSKKIGEKALS